MRLKFPKSPAFLIAVPVILAVCLLEISHVSVFQQLELMTFDWRMRLAHDFPEPQSNEATNLGLVEIGDNTIYEVRYGRLGFDYALSWPRDVYAAGLKELSQEGAKAVAFDVLFAETRDDHGFFVKKPDGSDGTPDEDFAEQIKFSSNVIIAADSDKMPDPMFRRDALAVANITVDRDADGVLRRDQAFLDYRDWDPYIHKFAEAYGWDLAKTVIEPGQISFRSIRDGTLRSFPTDESGGIASSNLYRPLPKNFPKKIVPFRTFRAWSMGILLAARELHLDLQHPDTSRPGRIILSGPNGLMRVIPVDKENYFYVDWTLTQNDPRVREGAFEDLLQRQVDREHGEPVTNEWTNKLVVIGSTATGNNLSDIGATPLDKSTYLVNKHLNVANSVLMGRFVQPTPPLINLLLIMVVGGLSAWLTWVVAKPANGTLLMLAFTGVYTAACVFLYVRFLIWAPIILPMALAGWTTHLLTVTHRVRAEQSQKKVIKQLFSRVLSPDVVNELLKLETIQVGGQRREITIYFADVRGFTELTDQTQAHAAEFVKEHNLSDAEAEAYFDLQAKDTLDTISTYLSTIADIVKGHKGTLDKYIGDCVMAFWGAPLPNPHHALDAVLAAMEAQRTLAEMNVERQEKNKLRQEENLARKRDGLPLLPLLPLLSMGTGINTGVAIVGFMGSETDRVNYTAFGREVNLASRLEGVSGHGRIIIGEGTYRALLRDDPRLAALCMDRGLREVKGFHDAVRIYEVIWKPEIGLRPGLEENTDVRLARPAK